MKKEALYRLAALELALIHFSIFIIGCFLFIYQFFNEKYTPFTLVYNFSTYLFVVVLPMVKIKNVECPFTVWERNLRKKFDLNTKYKDFWGYYLKKIFKSKNEVRFPNWFLVFGFWFTTSVLIVRMVFF